MSEEITIFAGTANPGLAESVARELCIKLGASTVERYPDGEIAVRLEESVRKHEVFIVQPTSPPVNDHLIELLAFVDACRRASAAHITAIVPYFGYARADKRHSRREPITASMVAGLMESVGIDHVITLDLHAPQIEGFFHIPVDSLTAVPTLCHALKKQLPPRTVIVSPDAGRVRMATEYAHRLRAPVVVLHKRRESGVETEVTHIVGDVRGRACLIVDDMISTGGTIRESIKALLDAGARPEIIVVATHGLLIDGAREKLSHESIREILVTDTVQPKKKNWPQLNIISVAPVIASAIRQITIDGSLSELC
jgi:ribose-phosphate pyrophosphokinase